MYPNVRAEIARAGITLTDLGQRIGMARTTIYDKASGRSEFSLDEALAIKEALGVDMTLEELFRRND